MLVKLKCTPPKYTVNSQHWQPLDVRHGCSSRDWMRSFFQGTHVAPSTLFARHVQRYVVVMVPSWVCAKPLFIMIPPHLPQGNSSVLMPVYNALCRTCKIFMALERALWMSSSSFQHILQSYEQITNILDKDTGFIGYQLGGDPSQVCCVVKGKAHVPM